MPPLAPTTAHHDPFVVGGPLTAAELERRAGQLDAAIDSVMATGSGASTTLTAQALAGQASLVVASSAGDKIGDSVWVGQTGATHEQKTILAIPDATHITLSTNLANTYPIGTPVSVSPIELVDARGGQTTLGGRLQLIFGAMFFPEDYGAKGDGATDDGAALNACITAAFNKPGGTVVCGANEYLTSATLATPANTAGALKMLGLGRAKSFTGGVNGDPATRQGTQIRYTGAAGDLFFASVTSGNKRQYLTFEGITFQGNPAAASGHGLHFQGTIATVAILPTLRDVTVNGAKQHGVFYDGNVFESGLWNVRISQCGDRGFKAAANGAGLPGETRFYECSINNNGVGIDLGGGGHFSFHGLTCSGNTNEGLMAAGVILSVHEANIEVNGTAAGNQVLLTNMTGFLLVDINMTVKVGGTGAGIRFVNCLFGKVMFYKTNSSTAGVGYFDIVFENTSSRCEVEGYSSNDFVERISWGVGGGYAGRRAGTWQTKQTHNVQVISSAVTGSPAFDATLYDSFRSVRTVAGITVTISPVVHAAYHNGQRLSVQVFNNTAGATTTTFSGIFHLAGAWVDPAAGKKRTIYFEYDDAIGGFIELGRVTADIT